MTTFIHYQFILFALVSMDRVVHIIQHKYPRKRTISATEDSLLLFYLVIQLFWCVDLLFGGSNVR